jgi:hypothetical protein
MNFALRAFAFAWLAVAPAVAVGATAVAVNVDFNARGRPISPLIFGVSYGDAARNQAIGYTLVRWGGNATTRYNWRGPAHNSGADYFFLGYGSDQTDDADTFIAAARTGSAQPLLTMPTMGWVEKFDAAHPCRPLGLFPDCHGAQTLVECRYTQPPDWCTATPAAGSATAGVDRPLHQQPDCRQRSCRYIAPVRRNAAAWITHLQASFGAASGGAGGRGVDGELMLWNSTHRDVHPDGVGFDELSRTQRTRQQSSRPTGRARDWPGNLGATATCSGRHRTTVPGADRDAHGSVRRVVMQQVCANHLRRGLLSITSTFTTIRRIRQISDANRQRCR